MGRSFNMYEEWDEFLAAGGHSIACTTVVGNAEVVRFIRTGDRDL